MILKAFKGTAALDAGLISSAQAVEHYEITRYGTLKHWAEMLGRRNAASLLDRSLKEESQTDEQLTTIAEQANQSARTLGGKKSGSKTASTRAAGRKRTRTDERMEAQEGSGAVQQEEVPDAEAAEG